MIQLYDRQVQRQVGQYFEDGDYRDPCGVVHRLLADNCSVVSQIHYLYQYLTKNTSIKNKRKRLVIVDSFWTTIKTRLDALMEECQGLNQDLVHDCLMKIMNIPVVVMNFDPARNLILQTYEFLIENQERLSQNNRYAVVSRLTVLGQESLLLQKLLPAAVKTIKNNFPRITKNYKILIYLIRHDQPLFREMIDTLSHQSRVAMLKHLIYSNQLKPSDAHLLLQVEIEPHKEQLVTTLMVNWCDQSFFNQSPYTQKLVSNLLCLYLEQMSREYLDSIVVYVNAGITSRFEFARGYDFVRQSGLVVWKAYCRLIGVGGQQLGCSVDQLCPFDLFEDDKQDQQVSQQKNILIVNQQAIRRVALPLAQTTKIDQVHQSQEDSSTFQPKNLYDCYLGLASDDFSRRRISLKSIDQFVRRSKEDLVFTWQKVLNSLLHIHDEGGHIQNFEKYRVSAVSSLMIYLPIEVIRVLAQRFFNKQSCLADKIMILNSITRAVTELSNNPKDYDLEVKEEEFYFKKVTSKYTRTIDTSTEQMQSQRTNKVDTQSRRWGQTKRDYQRLKAVDSTLIPLKRSDLLVKESNPFTNRLYQICEEVFFTFVFKIPTIKLLFDEVTFVECLFSMLNTFLQNIQNYFKKYRIIEEVVDILHYFTDPHPQIQKSKLGVLVKMASILDKNLQYSHLTISGIQKLLQEFKSFQRRSYDPIIKIMLDMVEQRFYLLLETLCSPSQKQIGMFLI